MRSPHPDDPVDSVWEAQQAVGQMVSRMIADALKKERARIAQVIRDVKIVRERVASDDPMICFSVEGGPDIEAIFESLAQAIEE